MGKIAFLIWIVLAPTLMGMAIVAVLLTPALASNEMTNIVIAVIFGAIVAMPLSFVLSKKIKSLTGEQ